ncbi:MAG: flagellar biosynthesis protein FlhB [Treponema sp.]|jgi:flagellar biosynthetic protein FlhB|nr:flagellar biosynthesis protein FlhB [Treponema sp.]
MNCAGAMLYGSRRGTPLIDLQWFAAEDEGRTEEPSEYKIRKAREEGRVAKSQELIAALGLLFPALTILFSAGYMLTTCIEMIRFFFTRINELNPASDGVTAGLFFSYFIKLVWPVAAAGVAAAVFSNLVQVGPLFTTKPLVPDFSRIVPHFGRYFKRTLFSMEGLFNFAKSIVKMAIIGSVAFFLIRSRIETLANLQNAGIWPGLVTVGGLAIRMLIIAALLLLLLSIPDMLFQRWQYRQSLKMTRQEVTEERKMYEGDPQIRGRIRQRMRELMGRNMTVNVARADVVVTNPTHFACALEYDNITMPAPRLSAKGVDETAFRMKAVAKENDVPIIENKQLARSLFAEVDIGQIVPVRYYEVLALVYAQVQQINETRRRANGIGA